MKNRLRLWGSIVFSVLLLFASADAAEQKWCPLCSMNLKMFWKTSHWLAYSDGTHTGYCSIHCASKAYEKRATGIDRWEVADYDTKKLIDAHKAHFLIGSDLPGTMTPISKLAFASLDRATAYQKEHGGTIGLLDDALKQALEGREGDMALIKKKVVKVAKMGKKLVDKHGCTSCHGPGGAGGTAPSWTTEQFARKMDSRVMIKEKILAGGNGMEAYEGKITEKELHGIAVYIWSLRAK